MAAFDPDFDPIGLVLMALINPAVVAVAIWLGLKADQWQKIIVAGFAAAFAGSLAVWLVTFVGVLPPRALGSDAGLFVISFVYAMVIAAVCYGVRGYRLKQN